MIVATFTASEWAGRQLSYDGCRSFTVVGAVELAPSEVVEFDRRGWLLWNNERDREMAYAIACLEGEDSLSRDVLPQFDLVESYTNLDPYRRRLLALLLIAAGALLALIIHRL